MGLQQDNIDKIFLKIEALKEYLSILEKLKSVSAEEIEKDLIKRGAMERYLQLSIETCIDISELIISDQRLISPATSREAILILGKENIINKDFAEKFSKAAGFRNILIHEYVKIDYQKLNDYLQTNLSDFHQFIKEILGFLK